MVTLNQVQGGVASFVDSEIIPMLPGWKKMVAGTAIGLVLSKSANVFESLKTNEFVKMVGIITQDDMIDIDSLYSEFKKHMNREPLKFDIPAIGTILLREDDIDKLYRCIINY